jgi:hypothetical protein
MIDSIPQENTQGTAGPTPKNARAAKRRPQAEPTKAKRPVTPVRAHAKKAAPARTGTKTAKVLALLKRPGGVTLTSPMKATGWQAHSVRGFLSGTIVKKMATPVESFKSDAGERSYRLSSK